MKLLGFLLGLWFVLIVFYTLYLAAINVYGNRDSISKPVILISAPVLIVMVICDIIMQMTLATIIFFDPPREVMVTQRLERYRNQENNDWRRKVANWICLNMLNPFDPTKHHC